MFELFLLVLDYCCLYGLTLLLYTCHIGLNVQCNPLERGVGCHTRCGLHLFSSSQGLTRDTHRLADSPTLQVWGLPMVALFIMLVASIASSLVGNISLNRVFFVTACSRWWCISTKWGSPLKRSLILLRVQELSGAAKMTVRLAASEGLAILLPWPSS